MCCSPGNDTPPTQVPTSMRFPVFHNSGTVCYSFDDETLLATRAFVMIGVLAIEMCTKDLWWGFFKQVVMRDDGNALDYDLLIEQIKYWKRAR